MGTYVEHKMEQFLMSAKTNKTVIDGLVLFEQRVNLLNGPVILMQLLWILASGSIQGGLMVESLYKDIMGGGGVGVTICFIKF